MSDNRYVAVTTFRRSGEPVRTPVWAVPLPPTGIPPTGALAAPAELATIQAGVRRKYGLVAMLLRLSAWVTKAARRTAVADTAVVITIP